MKASDIYGNMGVQAPKTVEDTNPTKQTSGQKSQAQAVAEGKPIKNTYAVIALISMVGILLAAKFSLEKR